MHVCLNIIGSTRLALGGRVCKQQIDGGC